MIMRLKNIYGKFIKNDILIDFFFGIFLLLEWNFIGSNVRMIVAALDGNMVKIIDVNSSIKCERSLYNFVKCNELSIYISIPFIILAVLLYYKHKKLAFLFLFLCFCLQIISTFI